MLNAVNGLGNKFNSTIDDFNKISGGVEQQISTGIEQVNQLSSQIAGLNGQIQRLALTNQDTNDLRDQRDQLIGKVSELVDVRTVELPHQVTNVISANVPLVIGTDHLDLQSAVDTNNQVVITTVGGTTPLTVKSGQLAGLLNVRNQLVPDYLDRIEQLAQQFVKGVDQVQATGLGLNGPLTSLTGQRAVVDTSAPLTTGNLAFPPQAGVLTIDVTQLANGQRTLSHIAINPATQNIQDVAAAITTGTAGLLQATVDPQNHTIQIAAQAGYGFDFSGRLPSAVTPVSVAGGTTATPTVGGAYTGSANDIYSFQVVGSGPNQQVGVASNLNLEVRNGANQLLGSFNIGQGYEPGAALPTVNGVAVTVPSGVVNPGDTYSVDVTGNPDSANILTALGVNTLFHGDTAGGLGVRSDLLTNPERLSASLTGQPGDSTNLSRLTALRNAPTLASGTQNLRQFYDGLVGDVGIQVQSLDQNQTAKQTLGAQLDAQRQSVSGVDPNEELVILLQFQRAFQSSAKYLGVVNETLNSLFQILG